MKEICEAPLRVGMFCGPEATPCQNIRGFVADMAGVFMNMGPMMDGLYIYTAFSPKSVSPFHLT